MKLITSHLNTIFCFSSSYSSISSFVLICNPHPAHCWLRDGDTQQGVTESALLLLSLCVRPSYAISQSCDLKQVVSCF